MNGKQELEITKAIEIFLIQKKSLSHGRVITREEAKAIGLNVSEINKNKRIGLFVRIICKVKLDDWKSMRKVNRIKYNKCKELSLYERDNPKQFTIYFLKIASSIKNKNVIGINSKRVQRDEIWSFCYAKQKNIQ
jgi:hypothetical protein